MPDDPSPKRSDNPWVMLARYSQIGFILPASTFAGWLIGTALDHWLKTTSLYIVGVILGTVAGFVELIRLALRAMKDTGGKQ